MTNPVLSIIDASKFPVVCIYGADLVPGDGASIIGDFEQLIRYAKPFVLIIEDGASSSRRQQEEGKARMLWLKENKTRMAAVCKGIVFVTPDSHRLPLVEKQAAGLQSVLGITFLARESLSDAHATGLTMLE
ncbi:hypothetical protein AAQ05_004512 [Salmonella enterica subsp. diarizonae]|nr:hypothetical protein [Salmonella enterica subsp. diarizonae]